MEPLTISDLSGGRNGVDSPLDPSFPDNQCVEALNVDFRGGGLGRKRGGTYPVIANTTSHGMTADIYSLLRHVPGGDETQGEVWAFENQTAPGVTPRLPAGTVWANPVGWINYVTAHMQDVTGVSFNGKLFQFYDSALDRAKVWDSSLNIVRVVGIGAPAAPTVADMGAGAYAATVRYYRVRFVLVESGVTIAVSEPSASVAFTPSGAGTAARVTRPALSTTDSESHWRLEVSPDNINFYILAQTAVGTSTYDDSAAVSSYANNELTELAGTYTLIPSVKFGVTDGNRLIMAGSWEGGKGSRVYWTPVLGSLNRGDDERLFQTATVVPYLDLDEKNGGDITGLGQINGVIYVFKYRQVWRLTPTTNFLSPYSARRIAGTVGAISHKCISLGEDTVGNPCLYFMSHKGPYRVGDGGLEYLGRDVEDLTRNAFGRPIINTTATGVVSHAVFYSDMWQWWVWVATGSNNWPNILMVLDVKKATRRDAYGVRGGWAQFGGVLATAVCSCMGNYTLGATSILRPWVGLPGGGAPLIGIADRDDLSYDLAASGSGLYQAYVKTKNLGKAEEFGTFVLVKEAIGVINHHSPGNCIFTLSYIRDLGLETVAFSSLTFTTGQSDADLLVRFDEAQMGDAYALQAQIGDSAAVNTGWQIDKLKLQLETGAKI